jgi:subtilisin-like proprotein convertase family protein
MPQSTDHVAVTPRTLTQNAGVGRLLSMGGGLLRRAMGLAATREGSCESLESRQLLDGGLGGTLSGNGLIPDGFSNLSWGDGALVVRTGSFLVEFDDYVGKERAEAVARQVGAALGVEVVSTRAYGLGRYADLKVVGAVSRESVRSNVLGRIEGVKSVEPDRLYEVARVPNDTRFAEQYAFRNVGQLIPATGGQFGTAGADIHVQNVWDISIGSRDNIVAIIDTGVDLDHPDLAPNIWINANEIAGNNIDDDGNGYVDDINGFDFAEFDADPSDEPTGGHGTPVAGTVGAFGNNGQGVVGVNWNVSIMALKIADSRGRLSTNAIVAAHDYATFLLQRGVNIVASNNSYGAFLPSFYDENEQGINAERDAIQRFVNAGGTFVASAGNSQNDNDAPNARNFPASYSIPQILGVAATDNNDALAGFSSFGAQTIDVAAPGVDILTTQDGGGYRYIDGTSFSGPIVAGAVALLKSIKPNASAVEIREALINGSDPLPSLQGKVRSGGRINVERALQILNTSGPVLQTVNPGPVAGQIDPVSGQPLNTITVTFSKDIDPAFLALNGVSLRGSGPDDIFGNGNDITIPVTAVARSTTNSRVVTLTLNLASFAGTRLPVDTYRLTLTAANFKDINGNFLNGNNAAGTDAVYDFRIAASTGDNEPNDTLATATPLSFGSSGTAAFTGVTLGNGPGGNLDVDLYRIDIPRGGLITAEVIARRLTNPSTLDSVLRLFNANGEVLASNDNFFAQDSYVDFFVATGGTYYIGVSGFGNDDYNVNTVASGASQSLGIYNVNFRVQIAQDDTVLLPATDAGLPRRIPFAENQTQGITTSSYTVNDARQILDVNVKLDIDHTFTGDLLISLIGPNNQEITLVNRRGGSGDNFRQTVFDDEATISIATSGAAPFANTYRPEQALGAFDGLSGAGLWTLKINDTSGQNAGQLNSWSLQFVFQNNIFGAFENNDTIATASAVTGINGTGTAQINAFLGDGGFGTFDRDIFRFQADGGSTLTARVTPTAATNGGTVQFNSAIRLFDSAGAEIRLSNPAGSLVSAIENYVFAASGTYYLAVSESNNVAYNPTLVGDSTGLPALTTGNFTLDINLAPGVSDPALVLVGNNLNVGISVGANIGATSSTGVETGLNFNGVDFLRRGSNNAGPATFSGLVVDGYAWSNTGAYNTATNQIAFSLVNGSDAFNQRLAANGIFRGLQIEKSYSYGINDSFIAIDVTLRNSTQVTMANLSWMDGFNPDPGVALGEGNRSTSNNLSASRKFGTASYINNQFGQGLTVGLGVAEAETRARVNFLSAATVVRDSELLNGTASNDPEGASGDQQIAISYDLGNLAAGGTTTFRYFIMLGTTAANVTALTTQLNNGTGTGHLTPNSATPALETLQTSGSTPVTAPTLPYRVYYPEGFYGNNIFTFLPISNPHNQATRVIVIARYEQGTRDQLVGDITVAANSRSGFTLVTPDLFANGTALAGRTGTNGAVQSYALEIRAERPVAATFSHYDLNQAGGARVAIGESFTTRVDTEWTFGTVTKGSGASDFLVFYNTTAATEKVTVRFFPLGGGTIYTEEFRTRRSDGTLADGLEGFRRGGLSINDIGFIPDGVYGVTVTSNVPIVAALSRFNSVALTADGQVGVPGLGSLTAEIPEGQLSLNATAETLGVLNANASAAAITFTFTLANGSAYRTLLNVSANSSARVVVADLPNFPTGQPYSVSYESTQPVTLSSNSNGFNDGVASAFADQAYTMWGFGEGFRAGNNDAHPGIVEYLRIFNPSTADTTMEITISYDGIPGSEVFRRTVGGRRMAEFNVDDFITGDRRLRSSWFSLTVKSSAPVVAYMGHFDRSFPGGFGTLGTPMGIAGPIN